jgi:Ion channel
LQPRRARGFAWRERVRDPSLTALLMIQVCVIFVAAPLAALGLSWARPVGEILVLALVLIVVMLSNSRGAIVAIVIGLGAILAHLILVEHPAAVVLYLNFAIIFASAYRLMWDLIPTAFANLSAPASGFSEIDTMLYFSFTTLTTTGYGDITPAHPFARSLANLEAIIGQLYPATILARLVTLELEHRRR